MTKPLDDLLAEREQAIVVVKSTTTEVVKRVEDHILSIIYIGGKLAGAGEMVPQETIIRGVRTLYDNRFQEADIIAGLKNLATYCRVLEHRKTNSAQSDYSLPGKQKVDLIPIEFKEGL